MAEDIIIDFNDFDDFDPVVPIKVVRKVVFGIDDYRSIIQNRIKMHVEKDSPIEVVNELRLLLTAISSFGKENNNIPRVIIDTVLDTMDLFYNDVFAKSKKNGYSQKRTHSVARKIIAFFVYRYTTLSQSDIGTLYLNCAFPGRVSNMLKDVSFLYKDGKMTDIILKIDQNVSSELSLRFPKTRTKQELS